MNEPVHLKAAQIVPVEHDPELPPRWVRVSIMMCLLFLLVIGSIILAVTLVWYGILPQIVEGHPRATIGIPWAGGAALIVVLIFRSAFGRIEFKIFGVEFKGASGPTVMWLLCFLAEVLAIQVLW